jgi:hypothetical protein
MEDKDKDYEEYKEFEDYDELASTIEKLEMTAAAPVGPDPQFKASARKRILNSLPENAPERISNKRARGYGRRTGLRLAAVFTAFALALSGVAFASNDSLPGDTLYPVKRVVEQGRVIAARNDESRASVYADLADKRLLEVQSLIKKNRHDRLDATLQLMGAEYDLAQASANKLPAEKREKMLARLETAVARQQTTLDGYSKNSKIPRAVIIRNLERIKQNRQRVRELRLQRQEERRQQIQERRQQRQQLRQKQMPAKSKATP